MTDKRLQIFCTVADQLSFSKAATLLGISQPAVTKNIALIEQELGQALFLRIGRKLVITDSGTKLYQTAHQILSLYSESY